MSLHAGTRFCNGQLLVSLQLDWNLAQHGAGNVHGTDTWFKISQWKTEKRRIKASRVEGVRWSGKG